MYTIWGQTDTEADRQEDIQTSKSNSKVTPSSRELSVIAALLRPVTRALAVETCHMQLMNFWALHAESQSDCKLVGDACEWTVNTDRHITKQAL